MRKPLKYAISLVALLGLNVSCGTSANSNLNASVNQTIEQKYSSKIDLSREQSPTLADNLNASRSRLDSTDIGSKINPSLKIGGYTIFSFGPQMEFKEVFERKVLTEVVIGRAKDTNGEGDGEGVFIDQNTVAAKRFINCKSQKVISDASSKLTTSSSGPSFLGLSLKKDKNTGKYVTASTDYTMSRGFYQLKENTSIENLLELCADIAKSDEGLKNLESINEVIQMNFDKEEELLKISDQIAEGKKVNNFLYGNQKFDFKIRARENGKIFFEVFPDTHWADPKLDIEVRYSMNGSRAQINEVIQTCKSNCQNYHDETNKHGIKSYGEKATKDLSEKQLKLLSTLFAARALNSK